MDCGDESECESILLVRFVLKRNKRRTDYGSFMFHFLVREFNRLEFIVMEK